MTTADKLAAARAALEALVLLAGEAPPGFYLTARSRLIQVVARSSVTKRWARGRRGVATEVPYRTYGDPHASAVADRVDCFGWLPSSYPLRPTCGREPLRTDASDSPLCQAARVVRPDRAAQ